MNIKGLKDENGKLIVYAWPGGYPVMYLDKQNSTLCPACAQKSLDDPPDDDDDDNNKA